jgi:signal transduction histidine kinase
LTVSIDGARRPLAPAVDQAAYRILQEALTNAARHGSGEADVDVSFGSSAVRLIVSNPAAPGAVADDGHGIVGMRERAALLGGTLRAEGRDGAFRVEASLPYNGGVEER